MFSGQKCQQVRISGRGSTYDTSPNHSLNFLAACTKENDVKSSYKTFKAQFFTHYEQEHLTCTLLKESQS